MQNHYRTAGRYAALFYSTLLVSAAVAADALQVSAPAGRYQMDPTHSTLSFSVTHLGVSNYVVPFSRFDAELLFDPADLAASSITLTVDPTSVNPNYPADYKASHPDSAFATWAEDLAMSEHFFDAGRYPEIRFRSTRVAVTGPQSLQVEGDLSLLGQTHPVTLEVGVVGSTASFPMSDGMAGIGFSARGAFRRSAFGMDYLVNPPLVGDTVTITFEGEFHEAKAPPPTP